MKNKEDIHFVDKVIGALRKSAIELEEFQVKAALGKADAQDKYEDVKKKFNVFIHESEFKVNGIKEKIEELNTKFDELRVQLALGKAETKEIFKKQKKQIYCCKRNQNIINMDICKRRNVKIINGNKYDTIKQNRNN